MELNHKVDTNQVGMIGLVNVPIRSKVLLFRIPLMWRTYNIPPTRFTLDGASLQATYLSSAQPQVEMKANHCLLKRISTQRLRRQ